MATSGPEKILKLAGTTPPSTELLHQDVSKTAEARRRESAIATELARDEFNEPARQTPRWHLRSDHGGYLVDGFWMGARDPDVLFGFIKGIVSIPLVES